MGQSLDNNKIKDTYPSLIKTTDNTRLTSTLKELTDGDGNNTGLSINTGGDLTATGTITANQFSGDGSNLTNLPATGVVSVNGDSGPSVVLGTDQVSEGSSNLYYTDTRVSANSAVAANTAKTGITAQQASDIQTNNAKTGITTAQADEITANTAKVGITSTQASEIAANTLKTGITAQQASDITANNLKVGITTQQADDIVSNNAKNSYPTADATKLAGVETGAEVNVQANWNETNTNSDAFIQTNQAYLAFL